GPRRGSDRGPAALDPAAARAAPRARAVALWVGKGAPGSWRAPVGDGRGGRARSWRSGRRLSGGAGRGGGREKRRGGLRNVRRPPLVFSPAGPRLASGPRSPPALAPSTGRARSPDVPGAGACPAAPGPPGRTGRARRAPPW